MTANIPVPAPHLHLTASPAAAMAKTLDRIAYSALCTFVFAIPWGEATFNIGPLRLVNWLGLIAFAAAALRTIITGRIRKPDTLHYRMLALVALGVYLIPASSWARLLLVGEEVSSGTLTHRTILWTAGLGAYGRAISSVADFAYTTGNAANGVAHNTFLSILVELGVVGALLLPGLLTGFFRCALRMPAFRQRLWITHKTTWLLFALLAAHAFSRRADQPVPGTSL